MRDRTAVVRLTFAASLCLALIVAASRGLSAQEEEEWQAIPWSQRGVVEQRVAYTDVRISYNRPVARDRTLFGGVVNWGRIWNPGADSATTIALSEDVQVEGRNLAAGRYTLWVIPRQQGPWTLIFNRQVDIFHTPYPGEASDALRLEIAPTTGAHMEVLAFYFPEVRKDGATLRLHWGSTILPIRMQMSTEP
jgi:hypothetical protein